MKRNIRNTRSLIILPLLALAFFLSPAPARADWAVSVGVGGHGHHGWDHRHHGGLYLGFPTVYRYEPVYYPVVVTPPVAGTVVYGVPPGARLIVVNGVSYYESEGTYYTAVAGGYQIVAPPVVYQTVITQPAPVAASAPAPAAVTETPDTMTVNIPNDHGGYTAVTLKKSGSGYTGPQGEFYPEFPKVAQLKAMYGK